MKLKEKLYFESVKQTIEKSLAKHNCEVYMYFPDLKLCPKVLAKLQELFKIKKDYFGYYKINKRG